MSGQSEQLLREILTELRQLNAGHQITVRQENPRTITINGIEVPEPLRVEPESEARVYSVSLKMDCFYLQITYASQGLYRRYFDLGILHSTPEAAAAHGRALASFTAQEDV